MCYNVLQCVKITEEDLQVVVTAAVHGLDGAPHIELVHTSSADPLTGGGGLSVSTGASDVTAGKYESLESLKSVIREGAI